MFTTIFTRVRFDWTDFDALADWGEPELGIDAQSFAKYISSENHIEYLFQLRIVFVSIGTKSADRILDARMIVMVHSEHRHHHTVSRSRRYNPQIQFCCFSLGSYQARFICFKKFSSLSENVFGPQRSAYRSSQATASFQLVAAASDCSGF